MRQAIFCTTLQPGVTSGGAQCTLAYLQALSTLFDGRVHYLGPRWPDDQDLVNVSVTSRQVIARRSRSAALGDLVKGRHADGVSPHAARFLARHSPEDTVVFCNGDDAGQIACIASATGFRTVFLPHNFPREFVRATLPDNLVTRTRWRILHRWALKAYERASLVLTLTEQDRKSFDAELSMPRADPTAANMFFGYRNGDGPDQTQPPDDELTLLISNVFSLASNERGTITFLRDVWPLVAQQQKASLILAGRAPRDRLQAAVRNADGRVELIDSPSHEAMQAIYARTAVSIAPTQDGSGIKLRVAESLRRGIPVVATRHCARGYDAVSDQVLRVYDTAEQAAEHLRALAGEDKAALAALAQAEYQRLFSFETGVAKLARALQSLD